MRRESPDGDSLLEGSQMSFEDFDRRMEDLNALEEECHRWEADLAAAEEAVGKLERRLQSAHRNRPGSDAVLDGRCRGERK
jgi:uncharacterized protein (DUF3084 family)